MNGFLDKIKRLWYNEEIVFPRGLIIGILEGLIPEREFFKEKELVGIVGLFCDFFEFFKFGKEDGGLAV